MLTVTRDGQVTGDYWEGVRKAEMVLAKAAIAAREQRYIDDYQRAKATEKIPKPAKKHKRGRYAGRESYYSQFGDRIERMFLDGQTYREISTELGISYDSARLILQRKMGEM